MQPLHTVCEVSANNFKGQLEFIALYAADVSSRGIPALPGYYQSHKDRFARCNSVRVYDSIKMQFKIIASCAALHSWFHKQDVATFMNTW
jgi:hypothetical protein